MLGRPAQSLIDVSLIHSLGTHPTTLLSYFRPTLSHGMPENLFNCVTVPEMLLSKKLPHGLTAAWRVGVRIPNLVALPIIASVSLTHIPCLFACFYESVSCVYAFFSTSLSISVSRAAYFVFYSMFKTTEYTSVSLLIYT